MMEKMNWCEGCLYAGAANGFKPECNCKIRLACEEENAIQMQFDFDILDYQDFYEDDDTTTFPKKDRSIAQRRYNSRKSAIDKANESLKLVAANYERLRDIVDKEVYDRANRKYKNAEKKSKRNKQRPLVMSFPGNIGKVKGRTIKDLIELFSDSEWREKYATSSEMASACDEAIDLLKFVELCDGEISALFRNQNDLYITIGFYKNTDLSRFERFA